MKDSEYINIDTSTLKDLETIEKQNVDGYKYLESLIEQVKSIDTTELSDSVNEDIEVAIEEQKVYFWIRVYLKEELNMELGDIVNINWIPDNEILETTFVSYSKRGLHKDVVNNITNYSAEDDTKIVCLMIDEKVVNYNDDIPFIRTLFKTGRHYEYQLVRRADLVLTNTRTGENLDYYDIDF